MLLYTLNLNKFRIYKNDTTLFTNLIDIEERTHIKDICVFSCVSIKTVRAVITHRTEKTVITHRTEKIVITYKTVRTLIEVFAYKSVFTVLYVISVLTEKTVISSERARGPPAALMYKYAGILVHYFGIMPVVNIYGRNITMGGKRKEEQKSTDAGLPIDKNADSVLTAKIPTLLKDAIGTYAAAHKVSMAKVVMDAIMEHIHFDASTLPKRTRKIIKYANADERKEAIAQKRKEEADLRRRLLDQYLRKQKLEDADKMEASLEAQRIHNSRKG